MTLLESYRLIHQSVKGILISQGYTEDKASRKANIYAVKNNWVIHKYIKDSKW